MNEYYMVFTRDCMAADLMHRDAESLGHGSKAFLGAHEYNHGFWVAFDDYPTADQVADNFACKLFRINAQSEIIVESRDGSLMFVGRVVIKSKPDCVVSGDWLTGESNYFCLDFD